jgi:sec-independent protein translocase protein TatB
MVNPPTIELANLGMADSLILMVLALVVFGPRRLPQIGRQIGKLMYEFRKASNDFKFQMEEELRNSEEADRRKREEAERQRALAAPATPGAEAGAVSPAAESESGTTAAPSEGPYPSGMQPRPTASGLSAPETPPEESSPRILPPSIGETITADRPGSVSCEVESTLPAVAGEVPAEQAPSAEESSAVTEQAAHNG